MIWAVQVAIPRPLDTYFTYAVSQEQRDLLQLGSVVEVTFGRVKTHAFIVEAPFLYDQAAQDRTGGLDPAKLKGIVGILEAKSPFTQEVFELCKWTQEYYQAPMGEVLSIAAPASALGLRNKKRDARELEFGKHALEKRIALNPAQEIAAQQILQTQPASITLLKGVTGSGKTEVYLEIARKVLEQGKSVLILVPEIALTPQLHQRFELGLGRTVGLWHSAMPAGQRRDQWRAILDGKLKVIVGARSAIFTPLLDLGLIVVDEEHDQTYKQEDRVRYHARDLAIVRAKRSGAKVVLGSATPSMESLERVTQGKYFLAELKERAQSAELPQIDLVDLREETRVEGTQAVLATRTIKEINQTLENGNQCMIFLNRRGFAAFLLCEDCGHVNDCEHCSVSLTVHKRDRVLKCHLCGHTEAIPDCCSSCQSFELKPHGAGTESLEVELPALLPSAKILRLDRDQITSASRLGEVIEDFRSGKANVLLGTQMLVKGHDFPGVTLVVVVLADALLKWPDFRAAERAFQVLTQVSGRAGRGSQRGRVLIQTFDPEHAVLDVITGRVSTEDFYIQEREVRQTLGYPPFGRMVKFRIEEKDAALAKKRSEILAQGILQMELDGLEVLGPSEAFIEKAKGIYRWDVLIKTPRIQDLQRCIFGAKNLFYKNKWPIWIDVDPYQV